MTTDERLDLNSLLRVMRRSHAQLLRGARIRREVAEIMAATDPGVAASALRAAGQYEHAAGDILKDIRWHERTAFAEMVVDAREG
jgi:hypothetical protein